MEIINYSKLLTTDQIRNCIELLPKSYYENTKLYIFSSPFQYLSYGIKSKTLVFRHFIGAAYGIYHIKNDSILIFEYPQLMKLLKGDNRAFLIFFMYHEFRHRNQFKDIDVKENLEKKELKNLETDANDFAQDMLNNYSSKISEALGIEDFEIDFKY